MTAQAASDLGAPLSSISDHVMLCVPPGTVNTNNPGWTAYAYVNSWLSVYNDIWCQYSSVQLHEVGKCRSEFYITLNFNILI